MVSDKSKNASEAVRSKINVQILRFELVVPSKLN